MQASNWSEQQYHEANEAGNVRHSCISSDSPHSMGNAELEQLCEAAMQDTQSAECWFGQAGTPQQAAKSPAASGIQELDPMPICARLPTFIANEVQTSPAFVMQLIGRCLRRTQQPHLQTVLVKLLCIDNIDIFQQAQCQSSRTVSGQRQQVTVADKQIQTRGNPERAPKLRSSSQTETLQPSLSMRSTRPMLGETTLNILEVSMLNVGRVSGFLSCHLRQEAVHQCVASTCKSA